jgi:4-amino-4-deoxy-L-arabinose transferase-like glycosyltransferase
MKALPNDGHIQPDWLLLFVLLVVAVCLRLIFFNGALGSDDLVYLNRSVQIAEGIWSSANYNGALRYGFNIPAGFFMHWFGINMLAANVWPLLCSISEVAVVYIFSHVLWGRQVALYAALMLTFMPLHIASATRIHADPVVSFFLTLSFITFYFAEQQRSRWLYFFAGICMGLVFWVKELAVVALIAFLLYPLVMRKLEFRWLYIIVGGLVMLLAHFILMFVIAGDPFHALKVVVGQLRSNYISGANLAEDSAWYYFKYLFFDIKHIGLVGWLAAFSVLALALGQRGSRQNSNYLMFWLLAILGVLSFTPVSFSPLKLVMKQSNYLTLFLAPLALVAGHLISILPPKTKVIVVILTLTGGVILGGLEQQAYRIFTSNSKAVVQFSRLHTGMQIVGSNNNGNIAAVYAIFDGTGEPKARFRYMSELPQHIQDVSATPVFVILDYETMAWGEGAVILNEAPVCWEMVKELIPTGFGAGQLLINFFDSTLQLFPHSIYDRLTLPLNAFTRPRPAFVYRANLSNFWCEQKESN